MARRRMIDPTIWEDENFGKLSKEARILFIGLFSNADDEGRIRANASYIRSTIFMYDDFSIKKIENLLKELSIIMKSILYYEINENKYIQLKNWNKFQSQRAERIVKSTLPEYVRQDGVHMYDKMLTNGSEMSAEDKLSKDKLSKEREKTENSLNYLKNIPLGDKKQLLEIYNLTEKQLIVKCEELIGYCEAHGKKYKDYRAFLQNALLKDYGKRPIRLGESLSDLVDKAYAKGGSP